MQALRTGHYSNIAHGTGVSVFLFDRPAEAAYCLCGSSPATRELHVLELDGNISHIDGLVFLGGSAFGLGAADGVMQWFAEHSRGKPTSAARVPIVPAAGIYDLAVKSVLPPTAAEAYQACVNANEHDQLEGCVGAGTGASVGKLVPDTFRMSGGVGRAEMKFSDGLMVMASVVVNCVGDVRDAAGKIIAGASLENGEFADCEKFFLSGQSEKKIISSSNTTLAAVFTNAKFSKIELKRIARVALSGMARAISPVFTRYDGDLVFCVSLGEQEASEMMVSVIAAEVVRRAIVNAVKDSVVLDL